MTTRLFPRDGMKPAFENTFAISLLFTVTFIYFYFFGTGIFLYQENSSLFIFSAGYFQKFADKPGGLINYAGNFLIQFYYSTFLGSLIISILILLIFLILQNIVRVLNAGRPFRLLFILLPSCLFMLLQTRYDFRVHQLLGFLTVLTWFYVSIATVNIKIRLISIILFPLVYYLAGSFTIVYLGLFIFYNLFYQKGLLSYLITVALFTLAVVTFFAFKYLLFFQPDRWLLEYPLFLNDTSRLTTFLSLISGFIILYPFFIKSSDSLVLKKKSVKYSPLITIMIILPVTVFILIKNYDPAGADVMKFEKMVYNRDWDGVIRKHEELQSSNIIEQYYYNLALSEKGLLCSRMFFGRQSYGSMALSLIRDDEQSFRAMYFYYTVGLTKEAHHLAYENMVQHGYRPENIKMLIKTELIDGNFKIAQRYINVLKKTLHYNKWAIKYEKMLYNPDIVKSDKELGAKLKLLPSKDFFIETDDFGNLDRLLQGNPDNRIAFEYKLARLLLEKDLMALGSEVKKLKGLGYDHFPRHIEEAIVSLVNITKEFPDMGGLTISPDTDQRFIRYFSDLKSFKGNRKLIEKQISKADRNTFWYYLQFGLLQSDFFKHGPVDNSIY